MPDEVEAEDIEPDFIEYPGEIEDKLSDMRARLDNAKPVDVARPDNQPKVELDEFGQIKTLVRKVFNH